MAASAAMTAGANPLSLVEVVAADATALTMTCQFEALIHPPYGQGGHVPAPRLLKRASLTAASKKRCYLLPRPSASSMALMIHLTDVVNFVKVASSSGRACAISGRAAPTHINKASIWILFLKTCSKHSFQLSCRTMI